MVEAERGYQDATDACFSSAEHTSVSQEAVNIMDPSFLVRTDRDDRGAVEESRRWMESLKVVMGKQGVKKEHEEDMREASKESGRISESRSGSSSKGSHLKDNLKAKERKEELGREAEKNKRRVEGVRKLVDVERTWALKALKKLNILRKIPLFFCDISFALGGYRYGGLHGSPRSLFAHDSMAGEKHRLSEQCVTISSLFNQAEIAEMKSEGTETGSQREARGRKEERSFLGRMRLTLRKMKGDAGMVTIRFLGYILGKLWRMVFRSIEVTGVEEMRAACEDAALNHKAVVLLPTHRSHVDYLLMSYVCFGFNLPMPYITSGENMNFFLIGKLLSHGGAFFINRRPDVSTPEKAEKVRIYKRVLTKYIQNILKQGYPIELFLEGGRSRTGFVDLLKVGILKIITSLVPFSEDVQRADSMEDGNHAVEMNEGAEGLKDILFVPVAIDYENVMENIDSKSQGGYAAILLGAKKAPESFIGTLRLIFRLALGGNSTHGKVFVNFGKAMSVKHEISKGIASKQLVNTEIERVMYLGERVLSAQREISKVTNTALLSFILLSVTEEDYSFVADVVKQKARSWRFADLLGVSSISKALSFLLTGRTNQFKEQFVASVVVPRYRLLLRLLLTLRSTETSLIPGLSNKFSLAVCDEMTDESQLTDETLTGFVIEGLEVLETLFRKRMEPHRTLFQRLRAWSHRSRSSTNQRHMELDATLRLQLQYCCGQLGVMMVPFSVASLDFLELEKQDGTTERHLAKLAAAYYTGADVSEEAIHSAMSVLDQVVTIGSDSRVDDKRGSCKVETLRLLSGHIIPSLASYQVIHHNKSAIERLPVSLEALPSWQLERERVKIIKAASYAHATTSTYAGVPGILNQLLIKRLIIFHNRATDAASSNEALNLGKLSSMIDLVLLTRVKRFGRFASTKRLAQTFRDVNSIAKRRLVKLLSFVAMVVFVRMRWTRR